MAIGHIVNKGNGWCHEARKYSRILKRFGVPEKFYSSFAEFVETGDVKETSRDFLTFFEQDERCQQAIEKAFISRIGGLQAALRALKG